MASGNFTVWATLLDMNVIEFLNNCAYIKDKQAFEKGLLDKAYKK